MVQVIVVKSLGVGCCGDSWDVMQRSWSVFLRRGERGEGLK